MYTIPMLRLFKLRIGFFAIWGTFAVAGYEGPKSDHFDGERFHNLTPFKEPGFTDFLKWTLNRNRPPWPKWVESPPGPKPPSRVALGENRITFINHATLLVQVDGKNFLTDPIYSERVGPFSWAGPKRIRRPGIRFEDLPPIDAVLVSHNHYDHLDLPTIKRLVREHHSRVFAGLGNAAFFAENGITTATDVDWWQRFPMGNTVSIVSVPVQHWSARGLTDRYETLWSGYVIESSHKRIYFSGDTGFGPHFQLARERLGPMDISLLPIGAYLPRWFMKAAHMSPADAVEAHRVLGSQTSIAMHFGTFQLSDEEYGQEPKDLRAALVAAQVPPEQFLVLDFGAGKTFSNSHQ